MSCLLVACGNSVTEDELYGYAKNIIEVEVAQEHDLGNIEINPKAFTTFIDKGNGYWTVEGQVFDDFGNGADYTIEFYFESDQYEYQWEIIPR
ncbi:hypothetical protein [Ornithinibacillus halotolerans]|uniref:hypothetical protein n=1 Tax=Ornithinibacillus halotolerans TaxID=1274357 RepID=UPI001667587C|nr:hypothetical protein [Ornithinibacillus halotolerans]